MVFLIFFFFAGAVLQLVYSQKLLDRALDTVRSVQPSFVSTLASKLQEHVKTAECDLYAHTSLESAATVIVQPPATSSALQVEACIREAEKLHALVEQTSPTLLTEMPLSAIVGSHLMRPAASAASGASSSPSLPSRLSVILFVVVASYVKTRCS